MPKWCKLTDKKRFGYSAFTTAKTAPSIRTRIAASIMKVHVTNDEVVDLGSWRDKTKLDMYEQFVVHEPEGRAVSEDEMESFNGRFFDFPPAGVTLYDDVEQGFVHWLDKDNGVFSCCVVPRKQVRASVSPTSVDEFVDGLECLQKTEPNCKRGPSQCGVSKHKYTSHGIKVLQGRGFSLSKIYERDAASAEKLDKHCNRLEHLGCKVIPSKWLRGMEEAARVCGMQTIKGCIFGAGLASAIDYHAPAHVDSDFFVSIHQLNVSGHYGDDRIVQYFVFPSCGYAIALRPGDVIVFNPHEHHCLSKKAPAFYELRVHVSTMYVKTPHISKNDKTAVLTEEEKEAEEVLQLEDLIPIKFNKKS